MSYKAELLDTLHDSIHEYGAMDGLKSDNEKSKKCFTMKDIFCMYTIKDCQSEPHYLHQNPIEWQIQDLKHIVHGIMECVLALPVCGYYACCMLLDFLMWCPTPKATSHLPLLLWRKEIFPPTLIFIFGKKSLWKCPGEGKS